MTNQKWRWRIYIILVLMLVGVTFSPIVSSAGKITPKLLGIPFALWTSFIITCIIVLLTYLASKVHPLHAQEENQNPS